MTFARLLSLMIPAAALALPLAAHADEAISTDRPDFVESSDVVGAHHWQIETGLTFDRTTSAGVTTRVTTTPTLVRIGLGDTLELRVEGDGFTRQRVHDTGSGVDQRDNGFSDVSFGVKWHQRDGEGTLPGVAWLLHVDTATGSAAFRGAGFRPSLRTAIEWDLPDEYSLGVMPGIYLDRNDAGQHYAGGILAATFGKAWTPQWHSFVEVAGQQLARKRDGGSVVTLDAGIAYVATPWLQFDVEGAHGVTDAAPDFEIGAGVSVRF